MDLGGDTLIYVIGALAFHLYCRIWHCADWKRGIGKSLEAGPTTGIWRERWTPRRAQRSKCRAQKANAANAQEAARAG